MILWYGGLAYEVSTWAWAAVLAFIGMGAQWGDGMVAVAVPIIRALASVMNKEQNMGCWIFSGIIAGGWFLWQWSTGGELGYTTDGNPPPYTLNGGGECSANDGGDPCE